MRRCGWQVDPFSDRPPWYRSVGRAFLSLKCLLHEVPVEHELAVLDERCHIVGRLRVSIMPGQLINNMSSDSLPPGISEEEHIDFSGYAWESSDAHGYAHASEPSSMASSRRSSLGDDGTGGGTGADTDSADSGVHDDVASGGEGTSRPNPFTQLQEAAEKRTSERLVDRCGQEYKFVVTVLNATGVSTDFVDVFCQYRFLNNAEVAFSTESLQNTDGAVATLPPPHLQKSPGILYM